MTALDFMPQAVAMARERAIRAGLDIVVDRQLLAWMAPGADYVLLHFRSRGWWEHWPSPA